MSASISSLLASATRHYEQKQYGPALLTCDRALKLCSARPAKASDTLPIRDVRVMVLVKQGRLDAATEEAKLMIRANKSDGRGYVRCCQIAKIQKDHKLALKWVCQGLNHLSNSDPLRLRLLQQEQPLKDLVVCETIVSRPVDPFTVLPGEIVSEILKKIDHRQLVRCLQVSKSWKYALEHLDPLLHTFQIGCPTGVSRIHLKAALNRIKNRPKAISCAYLDANAVALLCSNLEQWQNWSSLSKLSICASQYRLTYNRLSVLPFHKLSLKELSLDCTIDPERVYDILSGCQSLRKVRFEAVKSPEDPHRSEYKCKNGHPLPLLPNLQHLSVCAVHDYVDEYRMTVEQFLVSLIDALLT